jgi:hypothetical protein
MYDQNSLKVKLYHSLESDEKMSAVLILTIISVALDIFLFMYKNCKMSKNLIKNSARKKGFLYRKFLNNHVYPKFESENINQFDSDDFTLINYECVEIDNSQDLLMCVSFQKGVLFESIIEDENFDIKKLQIKVDGEVGINTFTWGDMLSTVSYDGIELDNTGTYTEEEDFQVYTNF